MSTETPNEKVNPGSIAAPIQASAANTAPVNPKIGSVPITDWIITFFLLMIPLLNIILLLVWAFSSDTNPSKANFAKAYLIIFLIFAVLATLSIMMFGTAVWAFLQNQTEGYY